MKIAAFYSDSPFAGWVQAEGFCDVLSRMGHDVIRIGIPPVTQVSRELADKINKPIEDAELILVSGPEHLLKWIQCFYPQWEKLKAPKVGWYHESFVREDYSLDYAKFEQMFDFHFFPDRADAEKYKGEFLPLGVDCYMFHSGIGQGGETHDFWPPPPVRDIDVAFIGLMYPKRARFVEELTPHLGDIKIDYRFGCQSERGLIPAIGVWDFDGLNVRRSMELLAETYRRIKVFVTFPSLSNVLVAKVLESLACGCRLAAPSQPVPMPYYNSYDSPYGCAESIRAELYEFHNAQQNQAPAYVHDNHRMELRFEQIFTKLNLCQISSLPEPAASSATIS